MSNELQTLNQRIAERVGKELIDLIPENQWQLIIDREVDKFKSQTLPEIIHELMKDVYTEKVRESIEKLTSNNEWNYQTQETINKDLEKFIGANAASIFGAMLSPVMTSVLSDLRSRLY